MLYYYDNYEQRLGPYDDEELVALAKDCCIFPDTVLETRTGTKRRAGEYRHNRLCPNFFYYDGNGQRQGPIDCRQLVDLTTAGTISKDTFIETESGPPLRRAEEVRGLLAYLSNLPIPPPIPKKTKDGHGDTANPIPAPPPLPHETKVPFSAQLSRAVFIFLAVFVGIFGVHDFYVKRTRYGWIHLALMSPWILAFLVSVFVVFGFSIYILCSASFNKEVWITKNAVKKCEKEITETEKERLKLQETLKKVLAGKEWKPKTVGGDMKESEKTETVGGDTKKPEKTEDVGPEKMKEPEEPKEIGFDKNYAKELQQTLLELENSLSRLHQDWEKLQSLIKEQQAAIYAVKFMGLVSTGPLWLYFFFYVLPVVSWIIVMFEIVYVTKDGAGKELGG